MTQLQTLVDGTSEKNDHVPIFQLDTAAESSLAHRFHDRVEGRRGRGTTAMNLRKCWESTRTETNSIISQTASIYLQRAMQAWRRLIGKISFTGSAESKRNEEQSQQQGQHSTVHRFRH